MDRPDSKDFIHLELLGILKQPEWSEAQEKYIDYLESRVSNREEIIQQTKIVLDRLNYHFGNKDNRVIPSELPFMREFLSEIQKLCDLNYEKQKT